MYNADRRKQPMRKQTSTYQLTHAYELIVT
jgi:hypothetical protein